MDLELNSLIASVIDGLSGQIRAPFPLLHGNNPGALRIGGRIGPRAGLNISKKRKFLAPAGIRTPDCQDRN